MGESVFNTLEQLTSAFSIQRPLNSRRASLDAHEVAGHMNFSFDPQKFFKVIPDEVHSVGASH